MQECGKLGDLDMDHYGDWLAARGGDRHLATKRREGLRALLASEPALAGIGLADVKSDDRFCNALESLPEWRRRHVHGALNLLPQFLADAAEMTRHHAFTYAEMFPGLGALGHAALRCGGRPVGVLGIEPQVREVRMRYYGRDGLTPPDRDLALSVCNESPRIFLVQLPFSAFVAGNADDDPSVSIPVAEAGSAAAGASAVLFRVDWTAGSELGIDLSGYISRVSKAFPGFGVRGAMMSNSPYVHMEGCEGFIAAAKEWAADFRPVAFPVAERHRAVIVETDGPVHMEVHRTAAARARKFPASAALRIDSDYGRYPSAAVVPCGRGHRKLFPGEIASLLGFPPEAEVPTDVHAAYHFLGESAAVPVAERAIRGLLRAIRLD